jgi:hypothetical protein
MFSRPFRLIFVCAAPLLGVCLAPAQDSAALIEALVRKGILTDQEAEDIRADLVRIVPAPAFAGGKSTEKLSIGGRMQSQYASLATEIGGAAKPARTDHFFLRRMYLTTKASLSANWHATMTYDFASGGYDDAIVTWRRDDSLLSFDFGLRKVNVAYEERATSGNIRSIERSAVTRYFVESNNGRRLGAASYRVGVFADGKRPLSDTRSVVYSAAITNPERNESFNLSSGSGDATNNQPAFWGSVGLAGMIDRGNFVAGIGVGHLPDQGGAGTANLGRGFDLSLLSIYTDITAGRFSLMAEYLVADVERGATATSDATPWGFYFQPTFMVTPLIEAVIRYSYLDSDRRGVNLSDGIRSVPGGGTMDKLTELFCGANLYLKGNDLKFQAGYVYGKTRDRVTGGSAEAEAHGVRSQVQMQY